MLLLDEDVPLPRLLITLGDVAGVGPEIVARAWPQLFQYCRPVVVGDPGWLRRGLDLIGASTTVKPIGHPADREPAPAVMPCLIGSDQDLSAVQTGRVSAAAGRAAYDFLCRAIDWTTAGDADGIVTAPLHKEGLHAAGINHPGHTEILAERTGVREFAMVLAVEGLAVAHVTLHMALRDVFAHLTTGAVVEKAHLLDDLLWRLLGRKPRLGVAALNPHASDGGLFGDEEERLSRRPFGKRKRKGWTSRVPGRATRCSSAPAKGRSTAIVAMYHDQGHIALKLLGRGRAVNISAGLPIVRTSVAHGTAYDIAGKGIADAGSLVEAVRIAALLARTAPKRN